MTYGFMRTLKLNKVLINDKDIFAYLSDMKTDKSAIHALYNETKGKLHYYLIIKVT